jgi:7-cyano-7-deazaguanine synthase
MHDCCVLFSGGIDSTLVLSDLVDAGRSPMAVVVNYGQTHAIEIESAINICNHLGVKSKLINISTIKSTGDIYNGRNLILCTELLKVLLESGISDGYIGCNETDKAGFPDCRDGFLAGLSSAFKAYGKNLHHPLSDVKKVDVVGRLKEKPKLIEMTWTCYKPEETSYGVKPCGKCSACKILQEMK